MKKSMIKKLVVLVVVMVVAGGFAFGEVVVNDTSDDSLGLQGVVDSVLDFSVTGNATATTLELFATSVTAVTDLDVADTVTISNQSAGYKLSATSSNNGNLESGNGDSVSYTAKLGSRAIDLANGGVIYDSVDESLITASAGLEEKVFISYDKDNYPAGTYVDTITFTIAAN